MRYAGIIRGTCIEIEGRTSLPDGTRVRVSVEADTTPARGSPKTILTLVGTLTPEEADVITGRRTGRTLGTGDGSIRQSD